jgi:hypothetical protein
MPLPDVDACNELGIALPEAIPDAVARHGLTYRTPADRARAAVLAEMDEDDGGFRGGPGARPRDAMPEKRTRAAVLFAAGSGLRQGEVLYSHLWPADDDRVRDAVAAAHDPGRVTAVSRAAV